jgi:protein-tyrosine phosphatase
MAESVMLSMAKKMGLHERVSIESAGTGAHPRGEPIDPRTMLALKKAGQPAPKAKSRRIRELDFANFEHILAMDHDNMATLRRQCPEEHQHKLALFLSAIPGRENDAVPDPYYGNTEGFDRTVALCEQGGRAWLQRMFN